MAKGLTDLLKKQGESLFRQFIWTSKAEEAFQKLKYAFIMALMLRHFDLLLPILVEIDTSSFTIAIIIL